MTSCLDAILLVLFFSLAAAWLMQRERWQVAARRADELADRMARLELELAALRGETAAAATGVPSERMAPPFATPAEIGATLAEPPAAEIPAARIGPFGRPLPEAAAAAREPEPVAGPDAAAGDAIEPPAPEIGATLTDGPPAAVPPPPDGEATGGPPFAPAAEAPVAPVEPPPPPRRPSLEERLGARAFVWLGSIAVALAGAYLVKLSLDQGWIGPRVRVLLALGLAFALLAAGERLRRTSLSIAQGVTAAGVAILYAALLATVHLYALIGPWAGFALLAATTAGAVGLALRHGQMVALIGLLGGLLTPHLVVFDQPRTGHLFAYLLLLEAGLLAASRRRGWTGIAMASLAGGFGWTVLAMAGVLGAGSSRGAAIFLLGSAALAALAGAGRGEARWRGPQAVIAGAGGAGALVLLAVLVAQRQYAVQEWLFLGLLTAGLLVLARLEERFFPLAALAAAAVALLLLSWLAFLAPAELTRFLGTLGALAALVAGGAYAALWGAPRPARWGVLAALAAGAAPLLAFAAADRVGRPLVEGAICLAVAALAALAAAPPLVRRAARAEYAAPGAALAVTAAALVALAAWYELDRGWLTVAWALEVPLLVELARRWRLPALWAPAVPLALLAAGRLVLLPGLHFPAGGWPVLNRLLVDYGVPAAAFAVAAWRARRAAEEDGGLARLARALAAAALLAVFLLVTLEVRHAFHPGELWAPLAGLGETGWWLAGCLGLAWGLAVAARRMPAAGAEIGAGAVAVLGVALAGGLLLLGLILNPALDHRPVGAWPVLNLLLWAYGVPLLLLLPIGRELTRQGRRRAAGAARAGALVAGFLLVTLEVRRAYRGPYLDAAEVGFAEWGGLIAAWAALALLLHLAGRRWPRRGLEIAGEGISLVALLGLVAGPLVGANPLLAPIEVGRLPVVNLLLWVYGAPALAFAALARELARRPAAAEGPARLVGARPAWWTAALLAVTLLTLEVRQAFHGALLHRSEVGFAEWGGLIVAWLVAAGLALAAARRLPGRDLARLADGLVVLALFGLAAGPLFAANPLWSHRAVGSLPVLNLLLWTYGVPALLLAAHAAVLRPRRPPLARAAGVAALVLVFVLVTLEVRQAFHGTWLDEGAAGHGEQYAYSAAWVLLGTALLVAAIARRRSRALRRASLAVMALAVGKVFLYDTAHLTDLYRVLSFLGLGLSLLLLAWLYQRFVFRGETGETPPPSATAPGG